MTKKVLTNLEIAELLRDIAAAYKLKSETKNRFKIIAYERAADAIEHLSIEAQDLWEDGKLTEIAGVGASIAESLSELFEKGHSKHFDSLLKGLPPVMFELMKLPGVGPKTSYRLATELKIKSKTPFKDLENKAVAGKIAEMEGFGEDSQASILKAIREYKEKAQRHLLPYAMALSVEIIEWLKGEKSVLKVDPLGSLRRKAATVGDIDLGVASNNPEKVVERFINYPKASRTIDKGERTASILLPGNIRADIKIQPLGSYGSLLQHFTGSKHHNVALREFSLKKGLSLSEYGIKKGGKLNTFNNEKSFYNFLGLSYIPPELREDEGEIEAALHKKIPTLLELEDLRGDLQIHSNFDIETSHDLGQSSMEEIIAEASILGYEYIAFTEHNPSKSKHSEGQIIDLLKKKKDKIDKINYSLVKSMKKGVKRVFNSLEIDILPDGRLPVPEKGLELLDFALVSIHSSFEIDRIKMTERVLSAFDYPKVKVFAHPSARLLNKRDGIDINWERIFEKCLERNIYLEINADPSRLDLPDMLVHEALIKGLKFTMGTDSHHKDSLQNMQYGVYVAKRGWATKSDIINTRSLTEFEKLML